MVELQKVTEIELDTENPFKHQILYYIDGKVVHNLNVPAYKSKEYFKLELQRWSNSKKEK